METPIIVMVGSGAYMSPEFLRKLKSSGIRIAELEVAANLSSITDQHAVGLVILTCSSVRHVDCLVVLRELQRVVGAVPIILLAENSSEELAIAALKAGVADYFRLPVTCDTILASARQCLRRSQQRCTTIPVHSDGTSHRSPLGLIGNSPAMQSVRLAIAKIAAVDSNVLITGETGTGKELVASAIHQLSPRHERPMVCINCAAIPDSLIESEMFGYEKGAFTGAHNPTVGTLQAADGGSIFLDEIGDMSPLSQAKILRAIETKELRRVGGKRAFPVDFRVIAATNHDLVDAVGDGRFRKDLYFRLDVARIHLPPLRARKEDVSLLCAHFISHFNPKFGLEVSDVSGEFLAQLCRHEWPGNVRELRNVMEAAFINHPGRVLEENDLPEPLRQRTGESSAQRNGQAEYQELLAALSQAKWNKTKAAETLQWSRMKLYRKLRKYQIDRSHRNSSVL